MAINWKEWRTKKLELMRDFMSPALKSYSREFTVVVFSVVDRCHVYTSSGWRVGCAGQMPTWHFSFPNKNISILTRKISPTLSAQKKWIIWLWWRCMFDCSQRKVPESETRRSEKSDEERMGWKRSGRSMTTHRSLTIRIFHLVCSGFATVNANVFLSSPSSVLCVL